MARKFFLAGLLLILVISCKKKKENELMFEEATRANLTYYKYKDTVYEPAGGSPHGRFKLKFNYIAASAMDGSGKLPVGGSFPEGSLIVKEVHKEGATELYAVMKKDSRSKYAGKGWLWAEYGAKGAVIINFTKRGENCVNCHSAGKERDYTRSFEFH